MAAGPPVHHGTPLHLITVSQKPSPRDLWRAPSQVVQFLANLQNSLIFSHTMSLYILIQFFIKWDFLPLNPHFGALMDHYPHLYGVVSGRASPSLISPSNIHLGEFFAGP